MVFYNIFSSKKEEKTIETIKEKIAIDYREKNSLVASELSRLKAPIEFTHLPIADYLLKNIAVERKTISDLKASIINKRIFFQIKEIKQYPEYLLLIEGINENNFYTSILHENALRGFLLSLALEHKIPFIFTENEKDTAKYLFLLATKKENISSSLRPSKIAFSRNEQIQYILEGFPYIGQKKSEKLIKKFGSIKNIINASEEELKEILGKRTSEFKRIIE